MESNKQCDICKVNEAICLCPQCFSYYCDSCYKPVHDLKENKDHIKASIDYNVPIDIWCPDHKKNAINLFCLDEKGKIYYHIILYKNFVVLIAFIRIFIMDTK